MLNYKKKRALVRCYVELESYIATNERQRGLPRFVVKLTDRGRPSTPDPTIELHLK